MHIEHNKHGVLKAHLTGLPASADGQVASTIGLMKGYALQDSKEELIRQRAHTLQTPERIHAHAKQMITFVDDVHVSNATNLASQAPGVQPVEVLIRPIDVEIMKHVEGDCDDFSMYTASLLLALEDMGKPVSNVRFVTIAADSQAPKEFSHVFVRFDTPEAKNIALDASHGPYLGWDAAKAAWRVEEWPVRGHKWEIGLGLIVAIGLIMWGVKWR